MAGFDFGHDWPWIGAAAGFILSYFLFFTRNLQADPFLSRWHDRTWLAWAAVVIYMVHNIEEYGIDLLGQTYAFPANLNKMFSSAVQAPPNAFYLAVNISAVWVAFPIAAVLSKRHPLVGLAG